MNNDVGRELAQDNETPPRRAWWPILMWVAFGATLLTTVIIVVQAILMTKGFD